MPLRHIGATMHAERPTTRGLDSQSQMRGGRADDDNSSVLFRDHGSIGAERFARAYSLAGRKLAW
jgi:hypothetical protein